MDTKDSLIGIGLLGIGGMLLFRTLKKDEEQKREQALLAQTAMNPVVQQAQLIRQGLNPNKPLPMGWDGTDEKLILATAGKITDLPSVQAAYRTLYNGSDLMGDLRSELSSQDFERFIWQVDSNAKTATQVSPEGRVTSTDLQAGKQYALGKNFKVWAVKDVLLRSAPEASSVQGGILSQLRFQWEEGNYISAPKSNIIELCKASTWIGLTTGKSHIDATHHVPFIEVAYRIKGDYKGATAKMKKRHGEPVRGWVSASADFTLQTKYFKEALDRGYKLPAFKS